MSWVSVFVFCSKEILAWLTGHELRVSLDFVVPQLDPAPGIRNQEPGVGRRVMVTLLSGLIFTRFSCNFAARMERIINKPALIDPHWSWNCQIGEIRYNAANLYNSTSYTMPQVYSIYFICTQFEMKPTIQYFLFFTHYDCNYFWEESTVHQRK